MQGKQKRGPQNRKRRRRLAPTATEATTGTGGGSARAASPAKVVAAASAAEQARKRLSTIREQLEGNICRCTGYHNIVKAVQQAAKTMGG